LTVQMLEQNLESLKDSNNHDCLILAGIVS
jgi:hypothetical protein